MDINYEDAIVIIEMARVCDDEGIGPDFDDLIKRVEAAFPDIQKEASRRRLQNCG